MWLWGNIVVFLILQVVASIFFKWGSLSPDKYWWGFAFGNLSGVISIIMLINVYKLLSPAATLAICTGGAFLLNQIGLLLIYKQPISLSGWAGIALIFGGILIFAFAAPVAK